MTNVEGQDYTFVDQRVDEHEVFLAVSSK
jgi:hypothetical protein